MGEADKPVVIRAKLKFPTVASFVERYAPNVSTAGFFLKTPAPKRIGTRVKFELVISDGTAVMRGLGEVAWVRETDEWPRVMGMGIRYLKIDDDTQKVVARILELKRAMGGPIPRSLYSEIPPPAPSVDVEVDEPTVPVPTAPAKEAPVTAREAPPATPPAKAPAPAIVPPPAEPAGQRRRHRARTPAVDLSAIDSMLADLAAPGAAPATPRRHRAPKEQPPAAPEAPSPTVEKALVEIAAPPPEAAAEEEPAKPRLTVSIVDSVANPAELTDLLEPGSEPPDPEPTFAETISFMPPRPSASLDDAFASLIDSVPPEAPDLDITDPLGDEDEGIVELGEDAVISEPQEGDEIAIDVVDGLLEEAVADEAAGLPLPPDTLPLDAVPPGLIRKRSGRRDEPDVMEIDPEWTLDIPDDESGK